MQIPRPQDEQAINRWVQVSLNRRYSAVLCEPVPEALLRLLDDL
jgi:hypothetical protein